MLEIAAGTRLHMTQSAMLDTLIFFSATWKIHSSLPLLSQVAAVVLYVCMHAVPYLVEADNLGDLESAEEFEETEMLVPFLHFSLCSLNCTLNLTNGAQSREQADGKLLGWGNQWILVRPERKNVQHLTLESTGNGCLIMQGSPK